MAKATIDRTGDPHDLLTTEQTAELLGYTVRYLTTRRSSGALKLAPAMVRGSRSYYARRDVWAAADAVAAGRATGECEIPGCTRRGRASRDGLCVAHRAVVERLGTREGLRGTPTSRPRSLPLERRFASFVHRVDGDGCELWEGGRSSSGYGAFTVAEVKRPAHVVAFEIATGRPVRHGFEIDHVCENRLCVRVGPGHIIEATHEENVARRTASYWARKATDEQVAPVVALPVRRVTPLQDRRAA